MRKLLTKGIVLSVITVLALTGCSSNKGGEAAPGPSSSQPAGEKQTITFYHGYFQDDWQAAVEMRKIYDEFAELHKDEFTFKPVALDTGGEGVYNKAIQEIARGEFPDIVDVGGWNIIPAASEAGVIVDLKPYIDADPVFKEGVGINYEQNNMDGKIYSVREQLETMGFWYNEDLFIKAGAVTPDKWQTWDDFSAAVDKISASNDVKTPFSMNQGWPTDILFNAHLIGTQEGRDFASQLPTSFDNAAFKNTIEFISKNALGKIKTQYFGAADSESYRDDFMNGDSAMLFNGVWEAGSFLELTKVKPEHIKPAVFPTNEAGKKAALVSASPGYVISNKQGDEKIQASVEFVKYMMSPEIAERIFTKVLAMPAYSGLDYEKYINGSDAGLKKLAEASMQAANADYKTKALGANWNPDIAGALSGKYAAMHNGSKDVESIVKELNEALQ
ncbi:ABC transporter substrate-binding protein [Paenibacillus sp. LHD-38]|uniref:ABC transporter substrate-binding protein n=1 Tax=Paenibacillus sp. LHD-38 TaxID=3072143 RepID=UPI00280D7106|nr:ABC transporter substrate-binding protein [Paenibacillus sp. LHD-38]MDQ8734781.1 ABC transporter substrate-binding protein [Paenibacillus sp. LHD-38]